jgi:hypothetical protein
MTYTVQDHGDSLEKEAVNLITEKFQNYQLVWQTYIGNRGNDTMASIPNYPDEEKRKNFAENSYTVLESAFLINHILHSQIFQEKVSNFERYIEFTKAFITVFALLGRMHDTVIKASNALKYNNSDFRNEIHKFYEARNIVLHGKKVPINFISFDFPTVPYLRTNMSKGKAWDDKHSLWDEVINMESEFVYQKLSDFFNDLLNLINQEYATFYHLIITELNNLNTKLFFEHYSHESLDTANSNIITASGSNVGSFDVYGFYKSFNK